ncbi:MAG: hypothetical protein M9894_28475 [Planctomycetes bacterium]|nr:hypothetical protein [Planctomycetota bacterium]
MLARAVTGDLPPDARALIYAPGGGLGHLTRALVVARALPGPVHVWHQAPAPLPAPARVRQRRLPTGWGPARVAAALARAARRAPLLVVDTFPGGLEGELTPEALGAFRRRVLVARHVRPGAYPGYEARARAFDARLLPYPPAACEWDGAAPGVHVGHLLRDLPLDDGPVAPLVVLGDPARLPAGWRARLPDGAQVVRGWAPRLPRARCYLSVGAGYHASYELRRLGAPLGLVPVERRYDDQFRRAARLGAGVHTRQDLLRLLGGAA